MKSLTYCNLNIDTEIPIEEPLEVVVEQEVAVETSPVVQIDEPETISGYHGNTQDTGSHQQSSDKCAIARYE